MSDKTGAKPHIGIVGAGIGGLAAAARLSHAGLRVTVLERHATPGGKMRVMDSVAGPVDAGPTVLTMKPVFEKLFADLGARIEDHLTLTPEPILARHFWPDGTQLDLMAEPAESIANIRAVFGKKSAQEYERFSARAAALFDAFDAPMMRSAKPSQLALTKAVLSKPSLIAAMAPHRTLASSLRAQFSEPKLAQLFGRYATYVGGRPEASPAILSLISDAEARGVWSVKGGMHRLALALEDMARARGVEFFYNADVETIAQTASGGFSVKTSQDRYLFDKTLFNGDPRALYNQLVNAPTVTHDQTEPRSLSAYVYSFAAMPSQLPLAGHNVFFGEDPKDEFEPLSTGQMPQDPTLYVCAQDRFAGHMPQGPERFEIIMNGPPVADGARASEEEKRKCQTLILERLARFGLTFDPKPSLETLTTPAEFRNPLPGDERIALRAIPTRFVGGLQTADCAHEITGALPSGRGSASGGGRADGDHLRPAYGRGDHERPHFNIDVPTGGYAWWYVDGVSDDGARAVLGHRLHRIGFLAVVSLVWARKSGK